MDSSVIFEAMRWACMDAITGAQRDQWAVKRAYPNGIPNKDYNKILCTPLNDIEKITIDSLQKDGYFDIAERELAKKEN